MNDQPLSDHDVRAAFAARAAEAPDPGLASRISDEVARTHQSRRWFTVPDSGTRPASQLAWVAVLTVLTVALVGILAFGVGQSDPNTVVVPSESVAPSDAPSADPSVVPSPSVVPTPPVDPSQDPSAEPSGSPFVPPGLGPDTIGRVVATDGLRVRSLPTVDEASKRHEPTLDEGVRLYVVDGPVMADGYAWYQVGPYGGEFALPFGWVAAGSRQGEPWIEQHLDGCDSIAPSLELLGTQPAAESLYCYGVVMPGDYELSGDLVCEFGDIDEVLSGPAWIEFDRYCELRAPDWNIHDGVGIRVWGQAATSLLDDGAVDGPYTVVGHVDDPLSSECEGGAFDGDAPDPAEAVLFCRMQFVVTSVMPAP